MKRLFTEVLTGLMDDRKEADAHRDYKQRKTKTKTVILEPMKKGKDRGAVAV